ncbi:MAG: hypothetical protein NZM43_08870 [Saprospiraceae bacterium]|nr:hypothetical protein [Saprospiraceae bacterium]MDW8484424.1 hypothetical protein [Saprospiraceae bacterium]
MKSIFLIPVFFLLLTHTANANSSSLTYTGNEPTFQDFLAQFPKASLPYSLDVEQLQAELEKNAAPAKGKRLGWEYYHFLPMLEEIASLNRMPVYPEPIASFETKQFYAVLYNTGRQYTQYVKSYYVSVFDKTGNHLATHFVAGVNAQTIIEATITENLTAEVKSHLVNWAKPYQKGAQDGNIIVSLTPAGQQVISLTEGNVVEQIQWAYKSPAIADRSLMADARE